MPLTLQATRRDRRAPAGRSLSPIEYAPPRPRRRGNPLRTRRLALWLLTLALGVECAAAVLTSPALDIREVRLTGLPELLPVESDATREAVVLDSRANIVRASTRTTAAPLARLPWVERVDVTKRPPNRLEVRIVARRPAAVLAASDGRWEVDERGVLIRPAARSAGLPVIALAGPAEAELGHSPRSSGAAAGVAAASLARVPEPLHVRKIEVDPAGDLCLNMNDGVRIRLGQTEELSEKLALVRRIYKSNPTISADVQSIDLRCPEVPACAPRSAGEEASQSAARRTRRLQATRTTSESTATPNGQGSEQGRR